MSTAIALGVAPLACNNEDAPAASKPATEDKAAPEASAQGKPDKGGLAEKAKAAIEIVSGPRDIEPSYPVALDTLLDLVPADAESFVVVRDVGALVHGTLAYAQTQKAAMGSLADEIAKSDPGDADDLRKVLGKIDELGTKLTSSGIDLSAGLVFAKRKGSDGELLVYGAAKADALPVMLEALGAKGDVPKDCAAVATAAGYSVCAKAGAAAFAPGKRAAALRTKIGDAIAGVDLERANVAAFILADGDEVPFVVETGQGMAHVAFALPSLRADLGRSTKGSAAPLLANVGPGQPFLWAQLVPSALLASMGSIPAPFDPFAKSLTGEVVLGGVAGHKGFFGAIGVTDPAPTTGLLSLASLGFSEIPKELPDGSKLAIALETVKTPKADVQTIHVTLSGKTVAHELVADMGYVPEAYAFAASKLAAITFGAGADVVTALASDPATAPGEEMLDALPAPLAKSLRDGKSVAAVYLPLDALHSAEAVGLWDAIAGSIPPPEPGIDPRRIARVMTDVMAPVSSVSMWISDVDRGPVVHVAVQGFGVEGTEEGKAALAAIAAVAGGADRKATYADLAAKHPSSPRAPSYKARAGEIGDAMASVIASGIGLGAFGALFFLRSSAPAAVAPAVKTEAYMEVPREPPPPPPP